MHSIRFYLLHTCTLYPVPIVYRVVFSLLLLLFRLSHCRIRTTLDWVSRVNRVKYICTVAIASCNTQRQHHSRLCIKSQKKLRQHHVAHTANNKRSEAKKAMQQQHTAQAYTPEEEEGEKNKMISIWILNNNTKMLRHIVGRCWITDAQQYLFNSKLFECT